MSQRKALVLSIVPFVLLGAIFLGRSTYAQKKFEKLRAEAIASPFRPLEPDPHRVDMTHFMRLTPAVGKTAEFLNEREKLLTGLRSEPFDVCIIGPVRLLFERQDRDWGKSGDGGLLIAELPKSAPRLTNRDPSAPFSPVRSPLYRKEGKFDVLHAQTVEGGSEVNFLGHQFFVRNWAIEIGGKSFPLDSPQTTIVLDRNGAILSTHVH